jgi:hypothetical protein
MSLGDTLIFCAYSCEGLLLVGPPGVGKTYAVKAARELCKAVCKVYFIFMWLYLKAVIFSITTYGAVCPQHLLTPFPPLHCVLSQIRIFEVNIPHLLCETDPAAELEKIFRALGKLRRQQVRACEETGNSKEETGNSKKETGNSKEGTAGSSSPLPRGLQSPSPKASSSAAATPAAAPNTAAGKGKQNTFTYRSPAAMGRATPGPAGTPLTAFSFNKKPPSTPATPSARAASSNGNNSSAAVEKDKIPDYFPELAFVVVDEVGGSCLVESSRYCLTIALCVLSRPD